MLLNDAAPTSAAELDDWLVLFRQEASLTRSQLEVTLAGIQFLALRLGKVVLAKKVTKGLAIEYPAKHAFPMLSRTARFIASKMAAASEHRLGVCMLLQQATGLRPSEMLGLCEHDIIRPSDFVPRYVLRLGTNVVPKVGREQTTFFDPEQDPVLAMLLFRLLRATPERGPLAACGYDHYRRVLARHSACLGCSIRLTLAGPASQQRLSSKARLPGRWKSEASFLVYIDVATALQVEAEFRGRALDSEIATASRNLLGYFPKGCFAVAADGSASYRGDRRRLGGRVLGVPAACPSRPVRSQPRQRAMTPPPRALQTRPATQARRLLGSQPGSARAATRG